MALWMFGPFTTCTVVCSIAFGGVEATRRTFFVSGEVHRSVTTITKGKEISKVPQRIEHRYFTD